MDLIKQSKSMPEWIGAYQIQVMNSGIYTNLVSTAMLMLTFWYTAGYPIRDRYLPWLNMWEFLLAIVILLWVVIPYLDYKFVMPSRIAFTNKQSFKHENAAMDALIDIQNRITRIEKKLEIGEESWKH